MRSGQVYFDGVLAGHLRETNEGRGMSFQYVEAWCLDPAREPISLTLPKQTEPFEWSGPSPFFMGLLPEGWLFQLALDSLKVQADDWFGQILAFCTDCIGAVHIEPDLSSASGQPKDPR